MKIPIDFQTDFLQRTCVLSINFEHVWTQGADPELCQGAPLETVSILNFSTANQRENM